MILINKYLQKRILMDKGNKRLREDDGDEGASLGLGYSQPEAKRSFSGGEASGSGSSLNFIKFTKANTNLDGSTSAKTSVDEKYEKDSKTSTLADISKLEVRGEIDSATLGDAAQYLERFHINLKKTMNSFKGQTLTVQQNFCNCAQVNSSNVIFLYFFHPLYSRC